LIALLGKLTRINQRQKIGWFSGQRRKLSQEPLVSMEYDTPISS
jgi:hypothetical protein